jgi:hypothetical protein
MFPFISNKITELLSKSKVNSTEKQMVYLKGGNAYYDNYPKSIEIQRLIRKIKLKLKNI